MGGTGLVLRVSMLLLQALAYIWFADEFGRFALSSWNFGYMRPTPGAFVAFGGWLVLFALVATPLFMILCHR